MPGPAGGTLARMGGMALNAPVGAGGLLSGLFGGKGGEGGLGSAALPLIIALLGSIFGGEEDEELEMYERMQMMKKMMGTMGMKPPYQSPNLPQLDATVMQALMNNMSRYANFGFPEGMQMDTGFLSNFGGIPAGSGAKMSRAFR